MKKHKIAFVGNSALTMMNFRLGIMKELAKTAEVVMITPADCDLSPLQDTGICFVPIELDCKGLNPFRDLKYLKALKQVYKEQQIDFAFHYTIKPILYGSLAASSLGIKHIDVVTGLGYTFIRHNWLFYLSCLMHKIALKDTQAVWFLNQDDCNNFIQWKLVNPRKVHIIHGEGINTDFFVSTQEPESSFIFLHCARMLRSKGAELFVQAAEILQKEFPDVRWQLLGPLDALNPDAITPTEMEGWVKDGKVEYLGVTNDVRPYLERCSCLVLPSYYMEGVPRSLMEAASMERPLIATDSVGCREVVEHGLNGFLCEKRSLESLTCSMRKMLELSREEQLHMGKRGRELMLNKFDERIIFKAYKEVLSIFLK